MSSSSRVHWALEELGVPYDKIKVDLQAGDQKKPEYLKLNPNGKVPLLVADGAPLFESLAILIYLGERFGVEKGLYPARGPARAEALKWMCWALVSLGEAATRLLRNTLDRFPADERNAKAGETAKAELGALLAILDDALEGRGYLLGQEFSFADLSIASFVMFLGRIGVDTARFARIGPWANRCTSRPAMARVMAG